MPKYTYRCDEHGFFQLTQPMSDPHDVAACPECEGMSFRNYRADLLITDQIWHTQGAHRTDYDKSGDKLERLNDSWSKYYGEPPPKAGIEVPKNSGEKY